MQLISGILDYIGLGGSVIWVIFFTCLLLWMCIAERLWFYRITYPGYARQLVSDWQSRKDRNSWWALKIREATVSEASLRLHARLQPIQALIVICPLLGLLGTVTGMVAVFEVIAASGNSDAQSMASGIYRATIPTMSGLVVALSGYYFSARLRQLADKLTSGLADRLVLS